ncbi:DNA damage-repair/toleration protein DRT100-like [Momordica charantia]|uniref:DNA damage-repair/toleration protein DRT100-like n=1 Tax=Momordica charantia TaxID=3673 RepID=A0A6J1DF92_MOMCH|nr:DNA damage-repair/toleration protein DRT100-like [Momordica charantia]
MRMLLRILLVVYLLAAVDACSPSERAALLAFRAALKEPYLGIFKSWAGNNCCAGWYGVSCDPTHKVTDISLRGHSEDPILAGRTGFMAGSLGVVNLSRNALEGQIPDVFSANSYFTEFDVSFNDLKGPIPKSLSSAQYIGLVDFSHNHLCGAIPIGPPFDHLEASSFTNNDCLCGTPLKRC